MIAIVLIVAGLSRHALYYSEQSSVRWYLGPMTHVFSFGASLSQVKMVADLKDGTTQELLLLTGDWGKGSTYGYFVRRNVLSAIMGQGNPPKGSWVYRLRKYYLCQEGRFSQSPAAVRLYWRDLLMDQYQLKFTLECAG